MKMKTSDIIDTAVPGNGKKPSNYRCFSGEIAYQIRIPFLTDTKVTHYGFVTILGAHHSF
jgi:hypothetical protein